MVIKTSVLALNTVEVVYLSKYFCRKYAKFHIFHVKKLLRIVVHFVAPPPPHHPLFCPSPPPILTIGQFSNFSRKKGLSTPVTP